MKESKSERRMAENEVFFRTANESIQAGFDNLRTIAEQENQSYVEFNKATKLNFICECSNETCTKRLLLTLDEYNQAHAKSPKCFVVAKGHEVPAIEDVVETAPKYTVVMKHSMPPQAPTQLRPTSTRS